MIDVGKYRTLIHGLHSAARICFEENRALSDFILEAAKSINDLIEQYELLNNKTNKAVDTIFTILESQDACICDYCKHFTPCPQRACDYFCEGEGTADGANPTFRWTCMDFDYGTCPVLEDTPCNGCFDGGCKGFEWIGQ